MVENKIEKYYTPDISELHVGYELEVEDFNQGHENGVQWVKSIIVHGGNHERNTHEEIFDGATIQGIEARNNVYIRNTYRTKYLDQSDIESCGWKFDANKHNDWKYYINLYSLYFPYVDNEPVLITHNGNSIFYGDIKSINELRKIMQWLNIK